MRDYKREAARRVSLLLVLVGWWAALGLCSCGVFSEEAGLRRQEQREEMREREKACIEAIDKRCPLIGKWKRMRETWEFTGDGRVIFTSTDVYRKETIYRGWYKVPKWGEIEFRLEGLKGSTPVMKGRAYVSGCSLYFRAFGHKHENEYYRVLK